MKALLFNLLLKDQSTGQVSHSKLLSIIGFVVLTYVFLTSYKQYPDMFLTYGLLVFGQHLSNRLSSRFRFLSEPPGAGSTGK